MYRLNCDKRASLMHDANDGETGEGPWALPGLATHVSYNPKTAQGKKKIYSLKKKV